MPKLFDTLHIRLKGPFCKCMATMKPTKGAYAIYFPVDRTGLAAIQVECKTCKKSFTIPWEDLNGSVVYTSEARKSGWGTGGNVTLQAGESGSPGVRIGVVNSGSAWANAEERWKDAERRFEEMTGRVDRQMGKAQDDLQRLWDGAPDTSLFFSQAPIETREQTPASSGSPHEPEPRREPAPADPETPPDTRPAYMRHLGLEEQK